MSEGRREERRKGAPRSRSLQRWLIHPRFQLLFVGIMLAIAAIVTFVTHAITQYYLHEFESRALELGLSIDHPLFALVNQQRSEMTFTFWGSALVIWVLLFVGGLALSHLIAGPVYRMLTHMNRLAREGQTPETLHPVEFRKGDFFPELAQAYNRVLRKLSGK